MSSPFYQGDSGGTERVGDLPEGAGQRGHRWLTLGRLALEFVFACFVRKLNSSDYCLVDVTDQIPETLKTITQLNPN